MLAAPNALHRKIQAAQDAYFQSFAKSWNEIFQELRAIQTDLERAIERAAQQQEAGAVQTAYTEYWRAYQEICAGMNKRSRAGEIFREYKVAIQKAVAEANVDELTFTELAQLSQSLAAVSQHAWSMNASWANATWNWGSAGEAPAAG